MTNIDPARRREIEGEALPPTEEKPIPVEPELADDGGHGAIDFAKYSTVSTGLAQPNVANDRILYLSMHRTSAGAELAALGSDAFDVGHSSKNDTIAYQGRTYDLASEADAKAFAKALGVSDAVADVLVRARPGSRDELARIAIAWSPAERGGSAPSRLVISGHSDGDSIYGDRDEDHLDVADVKKLAGAMPRAAAFVEDIHLAGCNTAKNGLAEREAMQKLFPNMRTFWGYQASSPLTPIGHLALWEQQTRGRSDSLRPTEKMILEEGVTVMDKSHVDGKYVRMTRPELEGWLAKAEDYFPHFVNGWENATPAPDGSTNIYWQYQSFQAVLSRTDFTPVEKEKYQKLADQALRLRFYDVSVRGKFQDAHAKEIDAGYRDAGLTPPDFSQLPRKEALAKIDEYLSNPSSKDPLKTLLQGFRDLDRNVVDTSWCVH